KPRPSSALGNRSRNLLHHLQTCRLASAVSFKPDLIRTREYCQNCTSPQAKPESGRAQENSSTFKQDYRTISRPGCGSLPPCQSRRGHPSCGSAPILRPETLLLIRLGHHAQSRSRGSTYIRRLLPSLGRPQLEIFYSKEG